MIDWPRPKAMILYHSKMVPKGEVFNNLNYVRLTSKQSLL
jgi:hypothetical protein